MFAYVLVFMAGLAGQPAKEVQIPWDGSLMQCMIFGQHQIAVYLNEHPGYVTTGRYSCTSGTAT